MLRRGKTSRSHARLDPPHALPSYMHEDHESKKCKTDETFKRLMIKVDTQVAKDRRDHGVAQNYPFVVIMDWVGSHVDNDELKRVDDAEVPEGFGTGFTNELAKPFMRNDRRLFLKQLAQPVTLKSNLNQFIRMGPNFLGSFRKYILLNFCTK